MWLEIICGGLTFKTSKRSGKRTPEKHCCPRRAGEASSLTTKCVPLIYQSCLQDPGGTNSSPGAPGSSYPWSWAHHEIAWRGWEAASPGLGFQDFLVATLTGKVSSGSAAANGCISLFRPRTLQCLNWKVHTISAGVGEAKKTQLK